LEKLSPLLMVLNYARYSYLYHVILVIMSDLK